jgi:hypothetical protein
MSVLRDRIMCGSCSCLLQEEFGIRPEERTPCSTCNSLKRIFCLSVFESVKVGTKLGMKHKMLGYKKPIFESIFGDDLHRNSQRWSLLSRIIDRKNDLYHEKIVDRETGEIIHECLEPLSRHVAHGSAKPKN